MGPAFLVLVVLLAFFIVVVLLLRRLNIYGKKLLGTKSNFKLQDIMYLDHDSKILSISNIDTEYTILLGKNGNVLIDKRKLNVIDT